MIDKIMGFINENTTLLIIICVFLIFVLIAYLIDNSIKTKKLAKMQEKTLEAEEPVVSGTVIPTSVSEEPKIETEEVVKEEPVVGPVIETTQVEEEKTYETPVEVPQETISEDTEVEIDETTEEEPNVDIKPEEGTSNELVVDPKINELLLKDFNQNDTIQEIEEIDEEITSTPVEVSQLEKTEEIVLPTPEIKVEEKKSPYKNDKKLSDIFSKKKEIKQDDNLSNTQSLENELDRILSKLNSDTNANESKDSTLDETVDFTNMF